MVRRTRPQVRNCAPGNLEIPGSTPGRLYRNGLQTTASPCYRDAGESRFARSWNPSVNQEKETDEALFAQQGGARREGVRRAGSGRRGRLVGVLAAGELAVLSE